MAFKITPFGGQRYNGHYADHGDIRQYLGFKRNAKLPIEFTVPYVVVPLTDGRETTIFVLRGNPSTDGWRGKSSAHRCFAVCPDCGARVPAGRTHQHKCK